MSEEVKFEKAMLYERETDKKYCFVLEENLNIVLCFSSQESRKVSQKVILPGATFPEYPSNS